MNTFRTLRAAMVLAGAALTLPATAHNEHYTDADLDQMLAPVALYPDSVLSHLLIAATHPGDLEAAARWSRAHPALQGAAAVEAVEGQGWDPSVEALVAFPELLARMDEDREWADHLGDAFIKQEGEVMDRVQVLRARAYDSGRLGSMEHVRVIREREYIYIEPAVSHIVYVPYYDPWYVYGSWWWPSYPPYCWRTWYGRPAHYYGTGFHWGVGFRVAPTFYFSSFYWPQRHVVVVHDRHRSRPIYSSRDVRRHNEVRRWNHSTDRYRSSARADVRSDNRVEHRQAPRRDSGVARSEMPRQQRRDLQRSDETRERVRARLRSDAARKDDRGREVVTEGREAARGGVTRQTRDVRDEARAERRDAAVPAERRERQSGESRERGPVAEEAQERRKEARPRDTLRESNVKRERGNRDRGQRERQDGREARGR